MVDPASWDIRLRRRSDFEVDVVLEGEDVTGEELVLRFFDKQGGVVHDEATVDNGRVVVDGPAGLFRIRIPAAVINAYSWDRGYQETYRVPEPGSQICYFMGDVRLAG